MGETPLILASDEGHLEVVKYLIKKGAKIKHSDKYNNFPLMKAVCKGHHEVVKCLIENGANAN